MEEAVEETKSLNFIEQIIEKDLESGKNDSKVHTRFPPEPNGYLHIGHAKAIWVDFEMAKKYGGKCNLRFDDTNPAKEEVEYANAIKEDIKWLGYDWEDREFHTSDYFRKLHDYATQLIKSGNAYVCEQTEEELKEYRGDVNTPGKNSPFRDRTVQENLDLFQKMTAGVIEEGKMSLRAKIDMASPNMHLRDPLMYRIKKESHFRTGNDWKVYPMYDFAHGVSDAIEGITHSICTLEFEVHRPLYEWFNNTLNTPSKPQQIEMARLNLNYTITSKRKLLQLVEENHVTGWDDPRMPTIAGLRRRGFTADAIKTFLEKVGVSKRENQIDIALLEFSIREDLNKKAKRVMGVLNPLKVVITNYEEVEEELDAVNNPEDESMGSRKVPFSKELYIEKDDFMEDAPKKFFRLAPGREVRLRYAYFVTCNEVIKDENGEVVELHCTYDPLSKGGKSPDGRKVKGTLHWVSAKHAIDTKVRLYDRLFKDELPGVETGNIADSINPDSLTIVEKAKLEPEILKGKVGEQYQFERLGYFCIDKDTSADQIVVNRTVALRDSWAKIAKKG